MKLLLLPPYFTPESQSSSLLDHHRYEAFAEAGMDMIVYTPTPTRGITDDVRNEYKLRKYEKMYNGKMSVVRYNLMKEGKNPIGRALRYFLGFIKQYYYGRKQKTIDCIFLVSTPPIQGLLGGLLKKKLHVPFVYNLQDVFPDSLVGSGLSNEGSLLYRIGRKIENYTYNNADKIIVISEDFKRNIMAKGVPESKIEVVYNWVDENAIIPVDDMDNPLFCEFGISKDKFRVVYAGNLGHAQNISIIVDAAAKLKNNDKIEFLIFGKGGLEQQLRERIQKEQLSNVKLLPLQPFERVSYVYSLGNVCIVSCKAGLGGSAMPSKTWSILSTATPVLANFDDGELKETLEKNNLGIFTKAGDLDGFVNAILCLSKDKDACKEMGMNGRNFILKKLTKSVGSARYVEIIKQVVNK